MFDLQVQTHIHHTYCSTLVVMVIVIASWACLCYRVSELGDKEAGT